MRIGFVSTYPPIECGIGTYTEALNNALKASQNETFIMSPFGAQGEKVFALYQHHSHSFAADVFYTSTRMTPDVMHIQHEFGLYGAQRGVEVIDLILRYRLAGIPTVTTFHTVNDELSDQEEVILKHIIDESSAIIVHEEFQKRTILRYFGDSYEKKIHIIEHGVREVDPIPDAKAKLDLEGRKVVLLCGYFRPTKGFHTIINLFPKICEREDGAILLVAGKTRNIEYDEYRRQLFTQLNESPVVDRIRILRGQFPQYTFDTILSAADVVVLPYEKGAQSGILSQCLALDRPVVVSPLQAFCNIVERSGSGLVCNSEDEDVETILRLLNDQELYRSCQQRIADYVREKVGWSLIAQEHIKVYHSVSTLPYGKARYVYFSDPSNSPTQ